ncbi:phage major capsid protein [Rhodococcus hoagii]|nr:phage major capsid protein [Prescottella equi]
MTLEELRARLAAIDVRLSDLGTEYRDAELPEAEQKEWDDLDAERAKVEGSITKIEARMARIAKLADEGSSERGSDRGAPAFHKKRDIYDLEGLRKDSFSADDFVERARDNARTALSDAKFPMGAAKGDTVREGLEALLDNADSSSGELAKRILTTGSATYERAFGKVAMAGNTNPLTGEEARALALGTDAAGGFAVPYQLDPTLIQLGSGYISPIRQLARKVKLIGKEWQTLTITEATVYRAAEGATAIDGSPTLAQRSVKVNKVHGFIPFSIELEQDWPQLRSEMTDLLNKAKAKEEANSFLLGTASRRAARGPHHGCERHRGCRFRPGHHGRRHLQAGGGAPRRVPRQRGVPRKQEHLQQDPPAREQQRRRSAVGSPRQDGYSGDGCEFSRRRSRPQRQQPGSARG